MSENSKLLQNYIIRYSRYTGIVSSLNSDFCDLKYLEIRKQIFKTEI